MVFLHHLIQNGKDPNCIRKKRSETEEAVGGCCGGWGGGGGGGGGGASWMIHCFIYYTLDTLVA